MEMAFIVNFRATSSTLAFEVRELHFECVRRVLSLTERGETAMQVWRRKVGCWYFAKSSSTLRRKRCQATEPDLR